MPLSPPDAVLFDLGNTILRELSFDTLAGVEAVLGEAVEPPRFTAEELTDALSEILADLEPRRFSSQLEFPPYMTPRLLYEPRGIQFDTSDEELEWIFWEAAICWEVEPGVDDVLSLLRKSHIPCGVVSNTAFRSQTLSRQLQKVGLGDYFSFVMASADYVVRKPHPLLFDLAARRLDTAPAKIWFVGDSYDFDIEGSSEAGMTPVWYCPSGATRTPVAAGLVVSSWSEFLEHLCSVGVGDQGAT